MAKIFSVLTLLIALGATFLGFQSKTLVEKLQTSAANEHKELDITRGEVKMSKAALKDSEEKLTKAEEELTGAKAKQREAEDNLTKANGDFANAKTKLEQTEKELADIKEKMKLPPGENIDEFKKKIADMQTKAGELEGEVKTVRIERDELKTTLETLTVRLKDAEDKAAKQVTVIKKYKDHIMVQGTRGTVTAVNPGWGFCVLSIGDRQGAATGRILIVTRGGQAIGKVKITNVEASQSVADIMPGTFVKGVFVEPGDGVIYTGDDKVRIEEPEAPPAGGAAPPPPAPPAPAGLALPQL
jgi:regulator of replication initiation timing